MQLSHGRILGPRTAVQEPGTLCYMGACHAAIQTPSGSRLHSFHVTSFSFRYHSCTVTDYEVQLVDSTWKVLGQFSLHPLNESSHKLPVIHTYLTHILQYTYLTHINYNTQYLTHISYIHTLHTHIICIPRSLL